MCWIWNLVCTWLMRLSYGHRLSINMQNAAYEDSFLLHQEPNCQCLHEQVRSAPLVCSLVTHFTSTRHSKKRRNETLNMNQAFKHQRILLPCSATKSLDLLSNISHVQDQQCLGLRATWLAWHSSLLSTKKPRQKPSLAFWSNLRCLVILHLYSSSIPHSCMEVPTFLKCRKCCNLPYQLKTQQI